MSEELTICRDARGNIICKSGRKKGALLEWGAPGLDIYLSGSWHGVWYEKAANVALNAAIERRINTFSLRRQAK